MGIREFRRDEQVELVVVTDHLLVELDHYLILCDKIKRLNSILFFIIYY